MSAIRTIGKLAEQAGVSVETVRYYERQGLLDQPRRGSGPRHYDDRALSLMKYVRVAQGFGLSLKEIKSLRAQLTEGGAFCASLRGLVEEKLADIDRRQRELVALRGELDTFLTRCRSRSATTPCPVIVELTRLDASVQVASPEPAR